MLCSELSFDPSCATIDKLERSVLITIHKTCFSFFTYNFRINAIDFCRDVVVPTQPPLKDAVSTRCKQSDAHPPSGH